MTFVRLDDRMPEHPKIAGLSDGAFRLYITSICYCSSNATDGAIPRSMLQRLGGKVAQVRELVTAGRFQETEDGWSIHDYLDHQRSREQIDAQRAAGLERFKRWRNAHANGVSDGVSNDELTTPEGRGKREEGRGKSVVFDDTNPPNPPQAGGTVRTRAVRAQNGSQRRRDQAALQEQGRDYEGSIDRMSSKMAPAPQRKAS